MIISNIQLATHQLDQQLEFYTRVLELPIQAQLPGQFEIAVSKSILSFKSNTQEVALSYHFAINIPGQQFFEAKRWLARRLKLLQNPNGEDEFYFDKWNAHACYFNDPAGNICELIARHNLSSEAKLPFTSTSLLNISEIGLVTDEVPPLVHMIQTVLDSPVFLGEVNELFTPLGDEQGLLILVKKGRLWFPEGKMPAQEAPLKVVFIDNAGGRFVLDGPPYRLMPER